jgi:hypothetical protein
LKLGAYVPLLVREFPDAAFTSESLAHVAAAAVKGFPTYGELVASLREWWADHRPLPLALAAPEPEPLPLLQREPPTAEMVEQVHRAATEAIAALRANAAPVVRREPTPRYLTPEQLDVVNPLPDGRRRVA